MTVFGALFGLACFPLVRGAVAAATGERPARIPTALWTIAAAGLASAAGGVLGLVGPVLAALGVALVHIDRATRRLPDVLVLTAYPGLGAALITAATVTGRPDALLRAGLAAGACLVAYWLVAATGALGGGDAKLAGLLGLALGWQSWQVVATATLLALCLAGPAAVVALARRGRRATIAFGPPLLLGALGATLTG